MSLSESEERELLNLLEAEQADRLWEPHPANVPQQDAYALALIVDEMFYGGAAGGGKSDLAEGLAFTVFKRSLILRREASDLDGLIDRSREIAGMQGRFNASASTLTWRNLPGGRTIRFGGCKNEADKYSFQGRSRDLMVFDEAPQFLESQVQFISGWLRTEDVKQHCLLLLTGNPPTTPEGFWIVERYAAWLDPQHPNPAAPGEIRWYARVGGKEIEVASGESFEHEGETLYPKSRTFIPAHVDDNPFYRETNYKAQLQGLPEPLRSQMLYGNFEVGHDDDPWQVIPTAWVRAAQVRWSERADPGPCDMTGVDVARGGKDKTVFAHRHGSWCAPLIKFAGKSTPDGQAVAGQVLASLPEGAANVNVDVIGVGSSVYDLLKDSPGLRVAGVNFAKASEATDRSGKLRLVNVRAEAYWSFREALDPELGDNVALPPDAELLADLCAAKWKLRTNGIQIEAKEDIVKRIGRSPDCADAVVLAFLPGATRPGIFRLDELGEASEAEQPSAEEQEAAQEEHLADMLEGDEGWDGA